MTPKDTTKVINAEINTNRILFLGNSITRHAPLSSIGWLTDCGMAASNVEKDYVHLVASGVNKLYGKKPEILFNNIAEFERNLKSFDLENKIKNDLDFKATLVIVALGENVPALGSDEDKVQFKISYTKLLTLLKNNGNPTIIVRSCFWADKTKDDIMKEACISVGGIYIDIQKLSKDESNCSRSEHKWENAGIGAHPGDKGMQAIADAILKALKKK